MDAPMCKTCKARHWGPCFTTKGTGKPPSPPPPDSAKGVPRPKRPLKAGGRKSPKPLKYFG